LECVLLDMFMGGSETTATSLLWSIAFLIHYPEVQVSISSTLYVQIFRTNIGFSSYILALIKICSKNARPQRWWNWQLVSISSTFYASLLCQYFCAKKLQSWSCAARSLLLYEKRVRKMLVKLTLGIFNCLPSSVYLHYFLLFTYSNWFLNHPTEAGPSSELWGP